MVVTTHIPQVVRPLPLLSATSMCHPHLQKLVNLRPGVKQSPCPHLPPIFNRNLGYHLLPLIHKCLLPPARIVLESHTLPPKNRRNCLVKPLLLCWILFVKLHRYSPCLPRSHKRLNLRSKMFSPNSRSNPSLHQLQNNQHPEENNRMRRRDTPRGLCAASAKKMLLGTMLLRVLLPRLLRLCPHFRKLQMLKPLLLSLCQFLLHQLSPPLRVLP
jgi:hypothetical protein